MATLQTKNFATLVQDWVAGAQAAATAAIDTSVGSITLAFAEAQAAVGLWLQGLILTVLRITRAATSTGTDLDTWVGDFGLTRIGAVQASGSLTFSRNVPTNAAVIPVGAVQQTTDGTQSVVVIKDTTNGAWSTADNGYVIAAAVSSLAVPAQAVNAGAQGNIAANAVTVMQTGIVGVDSVTNDAPFSGGLDKESDKALRLRFIAFINQLSKGTIAAFTYAAQATQQNIELQFYDNQDPNGTTDNGMVTVYVDDGTGAISSDLLASVAANMTAVKALGVRTSILAATSVTANIVATLSYKPGYRSTDVIAQVVAAIEYYVNGIGLGDTPADGTLDYRRLDQVIYDASKGVAKVLTLTINSASADLVPGRGQVVKLGTLAVS